MNTVFYDIDSQFDFLLPSGALSVPGAERIVPAIARLNRYAAAHGIPVISTVDAHAEDDPEFRVWPHHCVAGTLGQRKPEATLLPRRVTIPNGDGALAGALDIAGAQQIVIEKQTVDVFAARNLLRVIGSLKADRHVVYGVVTEICVRYAVLGLLRLGHPVLVITDAIQSLNAADSRRALDEIQAAGGQLAISDAIAC
jgi:nicotinamidase/pyrazinamidase